MPKPYYIFSSGILRRKDNTIYFEPVGEEVIDDEVLCFIGYPDVEDDVAVKRKPIPVEDIESIYVFGELTFNTKFFNFLAQNNIVLHIFNRFGFYSGSFYPREFLNSGRLLVKQVEHYIDPDLRIEIARKFVDGASFNMLKNLRTYVDEHRELEVLIEIIESERMKIDCVDEIKDLMVLEARIRSAYYKGWGYIVEGEFFDFGKRTKRPPENAINCLISFGNSMLYTVTLGEIYKTQLNPTISYLHEPMERRFSLALDIAEVFKPVIVDRVIFKLVNRGQVREEHFVKELNYCYLNEEGRKIFVKEFNDFIEGTVKHKTLGRNISYKGLIRLECYKLIKHLFGDDEYKPFKVWWV